MTKAAPQPAGTFEDRVKSVLLHFYHGWFVVVASALLIAYLLDDRFKGKVDSIIFAASPRWLVFASAALGVLVGAIGASLRERGRLGFLKGSLFGVVLLVLVANMTAFARPPQPAMLQLGSNPFAQNVRVDGQDFGSLPFPRLCLQAGEHDIVLEHPSYSLQKCRARLCSGATTEVYWDWKVARTCEVSDCKEYTRPEP